MTTNATVSDIPAIVSDEANARAEATAAVAAAQIDQATKDAEALARAAESTHLGARLSSIEEGNVTWRSQMETKLAEAQAATLASQEALKASILEAISTKQTPAPVVEAPVVEAASVSGEPALNSKQTDTTTDKTANPPAPESPSRRRVVL